MSSLLILRPAAECPPRSPSSMLTDHTQVGSVPRVLPTCPFPWPPLGVSLSAAAEAVTPRVSSAPGSLVFALATHFPKAAQKQSDAGHHFLSLRGLAEQGLFEGLTLHNELSLKVHFHILAAIRQGYYISMGFKCSNADTCFYSLYI